MKTVFEYPARVTEITEKNDSFDSCVIRVMYHGLNRKGMIIDKATVERAIPSLYYCPIVTNYDIEADTFGGHDITVVKRDDGSIRMLNLTDGIGVIPNDADYFWETVTEADGQEHEYLNVSAILWKRSAAYEKIKRDGFAAHSMEIDISAYHKTDAGIVVDDFQFEAFTVIGVEPCFESSCVHFSIDEWHDPLSAMLADYKQAFSSVDTVPAVNDITPVKGGTTQLDLTKLLAEFGLEENDVNFEIGEMTEEDVRAKFAAIKETKNADATPEQEEIPEQTFSLPASEIEAQISNTLATMKMIDDYWHEETIRYWYQDRDDAAGEIYLYDRQNKYVVGVKYTLSGDKVVIDFDSAKHKRVQYVDFEEGAPEYTPMMFGDFQKEVEAHVDALKQQIAELSKFKADKEHEEAEAAAQKVFSAFSDLVGNADYDALINNHDGMVCDAIEKECYAIRGKSMQAPVKFSMNDGPNRIPVMPEDKGGNSDEPYNGLFKQYNI